MNPAQLLNPKAFKKGAAKAKSKNSTKNETISNLETSPRSAKPSFDPAALLNPKAAAKKARDDPLPKSIQGNDLVEGRDADAVDFGSMIERQHGVTKREAMPQKRPQASDDTDDQDQKKRQKFDGGGKGGVIGQYIKDKQNEGQEEAGASGIVDLTQDDDVTFVSSKTTAPGDPNREVCLGTVDAAIRAHRLPSASKALENLSNHNQWPNTRITLQRDPGQQYTFQARDKAGNWFGNLDLKMAMVLASFSNGSSVSKFRWTSLLWARPRHKNEHPGQPTSALMDVKITLFAAAQFAEGIGRYLSRQQIWLGQPINSEGKDILNPHLPKVLGPQKARPAPSSQSFGISYHSRTVEEVRSDVLGMFDKITSVTELPTLDPDTDLLATELMDHQKQALYFLTQRETPVAPGADPSSALWKPSIEKDGSKVFYNVISGDKVKKVDNYLGGIFADMMGLGKTLSVLSRIAATLEEARAFGEENLPRELRDHPSVERNTGGTLIICPKSVLSNWQDQIKTHLRPGKFTLYVYSGPNRETDPNKLAKFDIVIASYNTVSHEQSTNSRFKALARLNWYRIVLDEAHMIRNQTTGVFKAACALESKRRWAVTGTPVQNRLDDLGALIKFIKISPFHEKGRFEQHFLAPFKTGDEQVLDNLRLLVDSITLRRSKEKIDLPQKSEHVIRLDFSAEERRLYEAFAKDSGQKMNAIISRSNDGQIRGHAYAHMLTFITRLRLICAHGRELLKDEDMKMLSGSSYDNALDLGDEDDDSPQLTEAQAYNMFHMMIQSNMNFCNEPSCGAVLGADEEEEGSDSDDDGDDDIIGYMTPCLHVYCPTHIEKFKRDIAPAVKADGWGPCPSCQTHIKAAYNTITQAGLDADQERRDELRKNPQKAKNSGIYGGPHTKVKALIARLLEHCAESELLYEEPPIRSVVFSEWTHYLDLIEVALRDQNIGFLRLDGKMSVPARTRVLEQFRNDPAISVCLVSIKAGGQGLNFTAANKVYVMEPQFNPGLEMQAVDRVHRIGQTREVEVQKFIMTDSFEEKILALQKQKMDLAATALREGKKLTQAEERKKRMADLRSLFK